MLPLPYDPHSGNMSRRSWIQGCAKDQGFVPRLSTGSHWGRVDESMALDFLHTPQGNLQESKLGSTNLNESSCSYLRVSVKPLCYYQALESFPTSNTSPNTNIKCSLLITYSNLYKSNSKHMNHTYQIVRQKDQNEEVQRHMESLVSAIPDPSYCVRISALGRLSLPFPTLIPHLKSRSSVSSRENLNFQKTQQVQGSWIWRFCRKIRIFKVLHCLRLTLLFLLTSMVTFSEAQSCHVFRRCYYTQEVYVEVLRLA